MLLSKIKVTYILSDIDKALAFEWIAEKLNHNQFDLRFILIVHQPAFLEQWMHQKKIPCFSFYYESKKDLPRILYQVYKLLKKEKPDLVHCHLLYGSLIGLTAAKIAGIKKRIYTRHHSDYHHRYFPKGIKWDKWCNRIATRIIAPSEAVRQVLMKFEKVPDQKISIVHHGFDLGYFTEVNEERIELLRNKYQTAGRYPVVGVIARFTELKGIQYIIPAFQHLLQQYPTALLLLFNAKGDHEKAIKQQLQEMIAPGNYRIIPFENDLAAVYRMMDVFVQASTDYTIEAFGQTYVEALAAGVPSVFTLSGIANDFIKDRENALVVPFKNADAIYLAMNELLNNSGLRHNLVKNGSESVQRKFSINTMIKKLEALYAGS